MFKEGLLVPFTKNRMHVIVVLFKIKMRWAVLIDEAFDMLAVVFTDVWRYCRKYFFCIPALTDILSLEVADDHADEESIVVARSTCS